MKAYTNIEQSKKLAEMLPIESADMWWLYVTSQGKHIAMMYEEPDPHYLARMESYGIKNAAIRCWSLAALLQIIPKNIEGLNRLRIDIDNVDFSIWYDDLNGYGVNDKLPDITSKEPVDACYEMVLKLHELNLLQS